MVSVDAAACDGGVAAADDTTAVAATDTGVVGRGVGWVTVVEAAVTVGMLGTLVDVGERAREDEIGTSKVRPWK